MNYGVRQHMPEQPSAYVDCIVAASAHFSSIVTRHAWQPRGPMTANAEVTGEETNHMAPRCALPRSARARRSTPRL